MATISTTEETAALRGWRNFLTAENAANTLVSALVAAMVLLPLFALVLSSFLVLDDLGFGTDWGLDNYREMVQGHVIRKAFLNTLFVSSGSTLLAACLGVSLAWINARTNCPFRDRLEPLNLIPFFLSPFVGAIAWHNLASPQIGLLNNLARDLLGIE
ncbi:MAG: hypothetical protein HY618_01010, partial [Candidatus Tectomicrobia bacterium]|nr:hypothetical protein [Candidatus Tectomicrobia bacterium]